MEHYCCTIYNDEMLTIFAKLLPDRVLSGADVVLTLVSAVLAERCKHSLLRWNTEYKKVLLIIVSYGYNDDVKLIKRNLCHRLLFWTKLLAISVKGVQWDK